jgi:hypothetical protein
VRSVVSFRLKIGIEWVGKQSNSSFKEFLVSTLAFSFLTAKFFFLFGHGKLILGKP